MFSRRQSNNRMFPDRELVGNPTVVIRKDISPNDFIFKTEDLVGWYYLVIPHTSKEVYYIQMLMKNVDVFVPSEGDGLLLSSKALQDI